MQKQILVGMFALAVAGTAFAGTPATPEHTQAPQTHKDQVLFQGIWRHVPNARPLTVPLKPEQTIAQVEKLAKEISADRAGDQPPTLYQHHGKDFLGWYTPLHLHR